MNFLPIDIKFIEQDDLDCYVVEGVMLRDFGPWKRRQSKCITFDMQSGTAIEYDDSGNVVAETKMILKAAEPDTIKKENVIKFPNFNPAARIDLFPNDKLMVM